MRNKPVFVFAAVFLCLIGDSAGTFLRQRRYPTPYPTPGATPRQSRPAAGVIEKDCGTRKLRVGSFPAQGGQKHKYFDASFGVRRLMEDRLFYKPCVPSGDRIDCNTSCASYEVFNQRNGETAKLDSYLSSFDNYLSSPSFKWPYVAYVAVLPNKQSGQVNYECRAVHWVQKERTASVFLVGGTVPPAQQASFPFPVFDITGKVVTCRYRDTAGRIHEKQLPLP
jgi:hypothetical protein